MPHALIVGMSESGKTTLAKRKLAPAYKEAGFGIIVLDPLLDSGWNADYITDDPEKFLNVFWKSRSCMAFMDEGGQSVGRYNMAMQMTATRGRHMGHSCHYICQNAVQLSPIVRDQCRHLFLFSSTGRQGKLLAEEWGKPELENCAQLRQFQYVHAVKFGGSKSGSISNDRRAGQSGSGNSDRNGDGQREGQGSSVEEVGSTPGETSEASGGSS